MGHARSVCRREVEGGNPAVVSFCDKHSGAHGEYLPYWILLEIVEFGTLCRFVWGAPTKVKKRIAQRYGLRTVDVLDSWMGALRAARNSAAHHSRYWNRRNRVNPKIPNAKSPDWHIPVDIEPVKDRAFGILTVLKYLLGYVAPQSGWADRLRHYLTNIPQLTEGCSVTPLIGMSARYGATLLVWRQVRERVDRQKAAHFSTVKAERPRRLPLPALG